MLILLVGPSALWMLSSPKIKDMWYDKLSQISGKDKLLKDIDVAKIAADTGLCLALNRLSISPQKLSLIQLNCKEKRFAICRIDPPREPKPKIHKKLPCLEGINGPRTKRSNIPIPKATKNKRPQHENGKCKCC